MTAPQAIFGTLALITASFALWALLASDPLGGEPRAMAAMPPADMAIASGNPSAAAEVTGSLPPPKINVESAATTTLPPGSRSITIINGSNGQRQEIIVPTSPGTSTEGRASEQSRGGPFARPKRTLSP